MSIQVAYDDELFTFIPFVRLPARMRAGAQSLARAVALYGQDGFLPWTFDELRGAAGVGRKEFRGLVDWIERLCLGVLARRDTGLLEWEEQDVRGICLQGILRATILHTEANSVTAPGLDLQRLITEAIAAALPAAIRASNAETKRLQRANNKTDGSENVLDKPDPEAGNVQDTGSKNGGDVQDNPTPSHAGAPETYERNDSNDSIKSYSSNDTLRSYDTPDPEATVPPELCEADVIQRLVERSFNRHRQNNIVEPRARKLVKDFGVERCLQALLMLGNQDLDRPGGFLNDVITKPDKYTIPPETIAEAKRLLSPSRPKQRPKAAPTDAPKRAPSEEDQVQVKIWAFQEAMTDDQRLRIDQETIGRMTEPNRTDYRRAAADNARQSIAARTEFNAVRLVVVREWALRGSDGPDTSQGGGS